MDVKHGRSTSGVKCHHRLWTTHMVESRRAWHAIIAFGIAHTIGRRWLWHAIIALGYHTQSNDVGRGMPSPIMDSIPGRTTSGVACHQRVWAAHTVKRRRAWHTIIAFGQHKWSNDVGRGMTSPPLDSTLCWMTSSVACHHRLRQHKRLNDVGRGLTSPPLDYTHGLTTSGVA